jgi:glycosyltransferase involved in cell wall biosynthesis
MKILAIDATNIKAGGGFTHLYEILNQTEENNICFDHIIVYGGSKVNELPDKPWLTKKYYSFIDWSIVLQLIFQIFFLTSLAKRDKCCLLFNPGGSFIGLFKPFVTMSQNMLVFEQKERSRFGISFTRLRLKLLNYTQSWSIQKAVGVIFISNYAQQYITDLLKLNQKSFANIPHGIAHRFSQPVKSQLHIQAYSIHNPFKFLYVSIINTYKHQSNVAIAIATLRNMGYPICLEFIGAAYKPTLKSFNKTLNRLDPNREFLFYTGEVNYLAIESKYHNADAFLFASTCENMPNILIEAMSAGLPIACSSKSPMPEFLNNAGFYFNPEDIDSMTEHIKYMLENPEDRFKKAHEAKSLSMRYTWENCSKNTFKYLYNNIKN